MTDATTFHITLLGRHYKIKCPPEEHAALERTVSFLNQQLQATREQASNAPFEQIAAITALNLAHQLMTLQTNGTDNKQTISALEKRLTQLSSTLTESLANT